MARFSRLSMLESQSFPDGDFPNVPDHVANPEYPRTLEAAIAEARKIGADLVLASDPDADRIGVGVPVTRDPRGPWTTLGGNEIGVLLAAFVMKECQVRGKLRPDHYLITTLVSTEMTLALARREGVRVEDDLLVGFKWIGQRIDAAGPHGFLFAFEESHGYLKGTHARDKDAAVAALLFAELAATVKDRKQTVLEYLDDLFIDVGHYGDRLVNKILQGREGLARINQLMAAFRSHPPQTRWLHTHRRSTTTRCTRSARSTTSVPPRPLLQPSGDLLIFQSERPGTRFAVRPSGTEPKIKFYLFARSDVAGPGHLVDAKLETARRLDQMTTDLDAYVEDVLKTAT